MTDDVNEQVPGLMASDSHPNLLAWKDCPAIGRPGSPIDDFGIHEYSHSLRAIRRRLGGYLPGIEPALVTPVQLGSSIDDFLWTRTQIVCVVAPAGLLYLWAIWVGSILALAIWMVSTLVSTVRMHLRGWKSGNIRFLAGFAIIPCYFGIDTILVLSIYGRGNPIIG
ncbi:hypothetical protein GFY24_34030 [Nocardia sp. SYP-A9097]|uniref:hypothetical protein n=1 Tax=Nocardia sp. SYP-A9097 TaxID=2663237 RepID=UPI00129AC9D7|nr:hypothetical protein [Nocardia sp. SYP-A9097]MRH92386.1 hypothetical protein [Nocardia sp. SYP-A9097]